MPTIASEESEVDIEVEAMEDSSEEEDLEAKEDEELGEDELEESDNEDANDSQSAAAAPLKIKLKLGPQPSGAESKASARRFGRPKNEDVESEDSDSDESEMESYAPAPSSGRQLTARQAVLASAVDPSHVTLDIPRSTKKTQFTPTEVALRKEENARKRKNMIEKKLEDEKAETIHRLLKKQSRPKNKRPTAAQSDDDVDMDEDDVAAAPPGSTLPMFRWVSTSRSAATPRSKTSGTPPSASMSISFSVPQSFLSEQKDVVIQLAAGAPAPSRCAVEGCGATRKYRAVGQAWGVGACGLGHLKVLEGRA
ncbi:PAPA-1-like conserved region-domain-containing protein [Mycena rosella]|uniref:PAPA-1-like conserved region-domain-containing protein n=1 Tax=Mycena rosella TaxID=1033263 RepID=A0AAD7G4C8_MYCRO|nr:PAPA-1-like conserved region-domain-containing protein [Mycena rosella]